MLRNRRSSHHASIRPNLQALEKRALLNAALPHVKHLAVHTEVSAAGHASRRVSTMSRAAGSCGATSRS